MAIALPPAHGTDDGAAGQADKAKGTVALRLIARLIAIYVAVGIEFGCAFGEFVVQEGEILNFGAGYWLAGGFIGDAADDPDAAMQLDLHLGGTEADGIRDIHLAHEIGLIVVRQQDQAVAGALGHADEAEAAIFVGRRLENAVVRNGIIGQLVAFDGDTGERLASFGVEDDAFDAFALVQRCK